MHRKTRRIPLIPIGQIAGVILLAAGLVTITLLLFSLNAPAAASTGTGWFPAQAARVIQATRTITPPSPRPCYVMNGDRGPETGTAQQHDATLPSGDAGTFSDGVTRVCTDGTWVKVTGYGNG